MATDRTAAVVDNLGSLCTVRVDPSWPHKKAFFGPGTGNPIGDTLKFTFLDLEAGISEDMQPNYADTEVVGRAEQFKTFVGATNRIYQLTFKFQAQGLSANTALNPSTRRLVAERLAGGPGRSVAVDAVSQAQLALLLETEVVDPVYWLEALKHPVIGNGGLSHAPPPVLLTVGRLIPTSRCVVIAATPQWTVPFDPDTLMPYGAEVAVTFAVVRKEIKKNLFLHKRQYGGGQ